MYVALDRDLYAELKRIEDRGKKEENKTFLDVLALILTRGERRAG